MDVTAWRIGWESLWAGREPWSLPLALIDLDRAEEGPPPDSLVLPPCPVIGLGNPGHPLAPLLDAVVERPVSLDALVGQVLAHPRTASVIVELLRLLPELAPASGLVAESMAYATLQGSAEHAEWLASREPVEPAPPGSLAVERLGDVLRLTLDRPQAGNAIDRPLRDALAEAFALAALDDSIVRVELRARGRSFSLGADLAEFGTTRDPATAHQIRRLTLPARGALAVSDRLTAHVQGACVGAGLELAACAHRLTASAQAWFQLPELAMGVLPGAGGCVSLTRRIGRQRTALMILSGRRISARTALDWGLVDALVDDATGDPGGADVLG